MVSPSVLNYPVNKATDVNHIVGPLVVTFAMTAIWEASRTVRRWNYATGAALIILPWIFAFENNTVIINNMATGTFIVIFSLIRGKVSQNFGGGWSSLFKKDPVHLKLARERKNNHSE